MAETAKMNSQLLTSYLTPIHYRVYIDAIYHFTDETLALSPL